MKKQFTLTAVALAVTLTGCATSKQTYTADGRIGHSINCSGRDLTWGSCYAKAGDLCGTKGYEVLEKSGEQQSAVAGSAYGIFGSTSFSRSMLITCKGSE